MSDQEIASPTAEAVTSESAPVETPVPEEKPTTSEEAAITESAPVEEPEQSKAVKELIAQRKRRQEAEKEAAYYKGIAEGRGHNAQPVRQMPTPQTPVVPVAPVSDNFETWEDYEKAKDEYLVTQAEHRMTMKFRQQAIAQQQQKVRQTFDQKIEAASKDDPSILDLVADNTLPLHRSALPMVYESDVAPELLRYLDKDRKEATRIYHLFNTNPILAARELTKIEVKLVNTPKPEPPKKVSLAPSPIKTVTGAGSATTKEDDLPMDEWVKRRNAPLLKRR